MRLFRGRSRFYHCDDQGVLQNLVKHKSVKGVAFTPNVDLRGRPAALASLPSNGGLAAILPKTYEFQI
jgi:hypothetical protein